MDAAENAHREKEIFEQALDLASAAERLAFNRLFRPNLVLEHGFGRGWLREDLGPVNGLLSEVRDPPKDL